MFDIIAIIDNIPTTQPGFLIEKSARYSSVQPFDPLSFNVPSDWLEFNATPPS